MFLDGMGSKSLDRSALVSISQTDVGHLMRITQCSILYRYISDVHENRAHLLSRELKE